MKASQVFFPFLYFSAYVCKNEDFGFKGNASHNSLGKNARATFFLPKSLKLQPYVQCQKEDKPHLSKKSFTQGLKITQNSLVFAIFPFASTYRSWYLRNLKAPKFEPCLMIWWKSYCEKKIAICQIKRDFLSTRRSSWKSIEKEKYGLHSPLTSSFSLCFCLPSHSAESRAAPGFTWTPVALESFLSAHKTTFRGGKSYCSALSHGKIIQKRLILTFVFPCLSLNALWGSKKSLAHFLSCTFKDNNLDE